MLSEGEGDGGCNAYDSRAERVALSDPQASGNTQDKKVGVGWVKCTLTFSPALAFHPTCHCS